MRCNDLSAEIRCLIQEYEINIYIQQYVKRMKYTAYMEH